MKELYVLISWPEIQGILLQYIDYRKKRLPKEKYSEFCKRVYTRYL